MSSELMLAKSNIPAAEKRRLATILRARRDIHEAGAVLRRFAGFKGEGNAAMGVAFEVYIKWLERLENLTGATKIG